MGATAPLAVPPLFPAYMHQATQPSQMTRNYSTHTKLMPTEVGHHLNCFFHQPIQYKNRHCDKMGECIFLIILIYFLLLTFFSIALLKHQFLTAKKKG